MSLFIKSFCVLAVVVFLAGCNQSGVGPFSSALAPDPGDGGGGEQLALVHNPEPATMLLWGAGLAGAAFAKRRKKAD
ncbi:MAG: PEP-CTERM sorting domain-containing protein [Candidatus Omnitrophica bacterium]|nr:PEP-CTERM sorting domain-containing protein [Candidatus Omnitrophota bacterium]